MRRVRIAVSAPYEVFIGPGALQQLAPSPGRFAVLIDEVVDRLHGARVRAQLSSHRCEYFVMPSGETHKTLATAGRIYDWLAERRFERREPIVAIGGGVTGDVAGFAAATWRRGVPLVQVPTTLLAQVDASVGGKVAVDHHAGKNLIGAFHQPIQVLADTAFLETLPVRERWSGLAEVVKTALLAGGAFFELVEQHLESLAAGGDRLEEVIAECVAFKAGVVQRDPVEHGERAILNLGHTVGHALEKLGDYTSILHGEAVAHGLDVALDLSGHAPQSRARRLVARLVRPPPGRVSVDAVLEAIRSDKKVSGGVPLFVLLDEIGHPRWGAVIDPDRVREAVAALLSRYQEG